MLLTEAELIELTGYKVPKYQVKWLTDRSWRFELNRLGQPRVDREYYRQQMGVQKTNPEPPEAQPNWAALDAQFPARPRRKSVRERSGG